MAKRKEGSLKGKGFEIFFDEKLKKLESQTSKSLESKKSKRQDVQKSKLQKTKTSEILEVRTSDSLVESFSPTLSKRLKERKRSNRVWQRTIYLTHEEEKILLKIKARLFEKGYEVEYSEIIGKALKFFGEKFFLT